MPAVGLQKEGNAVLGAAEASEAVPRSDLDAVLSQSSPDGHVGGAVLVTDPGQGPASSVEGRRVIEVVSRQAELADDRALVPREMFCKDHHIRLLRPPRSAAAIGAGRLHALYPGKGSLGLTH